MSTLDEEPIFDAGQIVSELRRCACSGRTRSFEWRLYHYICLLETLECLNANGLLSQFIIVMTCICAKLVNVSHANHFIKSHRIYYCDFLVIYLQTMSLNSLKIMKKSPITEYRDLSQLKTVQILVCQTFPLPCRVQPRSLCTKCWRERERAWESVWGQVEWGGLMN